MTTLPRIDSFRSAVLGSSDSEDDGQSYDQMDKFILFPILVSFIFFYGLFSIPVLLSAASIVLVACSETLPFLVWRWSVNFMGVFAAIWWISESVNAGVTSAQSFMSAYLVMLVMLHLKIPSHEYFVVSSVFATASLLITNGAYLLSLFDIVNAPSWMMVASSYDASEERFRFNQTLFLIVAFTFFIFEADLITKNWSSSQSTAKAEVQRANTLKNEKTMEKKGVVKTAVNRLFVKAFGNYDIFSREVAKFVKEVKSNLSKESLDLMNEKECDFSAFELERKLASGGFCTVFRGKWKPGNRPCAVKSFSSADRLDSAGLRGLVNEVVVLTTLNHNHIIKVLGYCWSPQVCLVMEYMAKGTLHDMLAYKSLSISWDAPLLSLAIQIADAIGYLHTRNPPIIHRDIKARNILMKDFRTCKLADFGLMVEEGSDQARAGTVRYVAPEVVQRADHSQQNTTRADMWSFGVCLWEMATRAQFSGLPPSYMLFSQAKRTLFVSKLPYRIPNAVYDVIEACLQPDPEKRTIQAKKAEESLRAALTTLDDESSWFNDESLPKVNVSIIQPVSNYPLEDLSVDASMSLRADSMWRKSALNAGTFGSVLQHPPLQALDTTKRIEEVSPLHASALKSRLGRAEARNSRQLMKMDEDLPPLPQQLPNMVVHERLGLLSRLAEADMKSKVELERKVQSNSLQTLGDGGSEQSCRLLEMAFVPPAPETTYVSFASDKRFEQGHLDGKSGQQSTVGAASQIVPPADAPTRLGLLSRLALAENRTQIEAQTRFAAGSGSVTDLFTSEGDSTDVQNDDEVAGEGGEGSSSGVFKQQKRRGNVRNAGVSNSRLLDVLASEESYLTSTPTLQTNGSVDMHHRLGLLARLADAEAHATDDLIEKVTSKRTLDDSCRLLRMEFEKPPKNVDEGEDEEEEEEQNGDNDDDGTTVQSSSKRSSTSSLETRFLARLGVNISGDQQGNGGSKESLLFPEGDHHHHHPPQSSTESILSPMESRLLGRLGDGNTQTHPSQDQHHQVVEPHEHHERERVPSDSQTNKIFTNAMTSSSSANTLRQQQQAQSTSAESEAAATLFRNSRRLISTSGLPHGNKASLAGPTEVSTIMNEEEQKEGPAQANNPAFKQSSAQGLLARLHFAEQSAVNEMESRVKNGETTVSCSLLSFPMDEGNEEEVEDEEEAEEEEGLHEKPEQSSKEAQISAISFLKGPSTALLSRLADAEASAVAELKAKVETGRVNVSSSLLSFPMDEAEEEEEEDEEFDGDGRNTNGLSKGEDGVDQQSLIREEEKFPEHHEGNNLKVGDGDALHLQDDSAVDKLPLGKDPSLHEQEDDDNQKKNLLESPLDQAAMTKGDHVNSDNSQPSSNISSPDSIRRAQSHDKANTPISTPSPTSSMAVFRPSGARSATPSMMGGGMDEKAIRNFDIHSEPRQRLARAHTYQSPLERLVLSPSPYPLPRRNSNASFSSFSQSTRDLHTRFVLGPLPDLSKADDESG